MLISDRHLLRTMTIHEDAKDPVAVRFKGSWHLYGSGGDSHTESWGILHMTGPSPEGPWTQQDVTFLDIPGEGIAAPGIIAEDDRLHMVIQTEFERPGGRIEYLTSDDAKTWTHHETAMLSLPGTDQAGIYDPHPARIKGWPYFTYSAFPAGTPKPQPDIYLARSVTGAWRGPWLKLGKILDHRDVTSHHNDRDHPDYEWGLEGSQLIELPDGRILLSAVCFLPNVPCGQRQRVFFAISEAPQGPYRTLGPVIPALPGGENGHAAGWCDGSHLHLMYQERAPSTGMRWRYGLATYDIESLLSLAEFGCISQPSTV